MTDRLDRFESQLTAAVVRRNRRSRRRRVASAAAVATIAVSAGAGAATDTLDPLGLFTSNPATRNEGPMRPTTDTRLELRSADAEPIAWSIAVYRARDAVCGGIAVPKQPRPSIVCQGAFPIAQELQPRAFRAQTSGLILGTVGDDRKRVLVYGFVDGDAPELAIEVDGQTLGDLSRTDGAIEVPIDHDSPSLTPEGHKIVATLPDALTLRLVAVAVTVSTEQLDRLVMVDRKTGSREPVAPPQE